MDLLRSNQNQTPQETPQEVPEVKKHLWSITKGIDDHQMRAGEVDDAQREFLKTTEFVK